MAATGPVFLGAALAVGWTGAEIVFASRTSSRIKERLVRAAPLFISGCGVAMARPHLSARLMRTVDDPLEGGAAAAAITTVQSISGAFGAGGELAAARGLFAGFAVLTAIEIVG